MSFRFVEEHSGTFSTERLGQVMNVSPRGLWAFRSWPVSRGQHMDMCGSGPYQGTITPVSGQSWPLEDD